MTFIQIGLGLLSAPALCSSIYLLVLTALSRANRRPSPSTRKLRFQIVVPAHNEQKLIARTVASLRKLDWPEANRKIWVVADNCSDATAEISRSAGARVIERTNPTRRGKGYALELAFRASAMENWADAIVVVDADSDVSSNLLAAFASRIEAGAEAVQAHYGILNPLDSWRTRLLTIAKASFHTLRSRARERLQLSCGIRGNGWCVTLPLLTRIPYKAYSLTEDLEYGIALGRAGVRVYYADEAHANAEMAVADADAGRQRQRWEDGRFQLIRSQTWPLLTAAWRMRSRVCLDLAFDLLVLPLSYVVLNVILLALLAGTGMLFGLPLGGWLWVAFGCCACLVVYVLRGLQLSGLGRSGLLTLCCVPAFIAWKLVVMFGHRRSGEWISTGRNPS